MYKRTHKPNSKIAFCHYFKNAKFCLFEKSECKFLYYDAHLCKHNTSCKRKMCPYKHDSKSMESGMDGNTRPDDSHESSESDLIENISEKQSNSLTLEQYEAREIFCDNYCSRENRIHIHDSQNYKMYKGVNIIEVDEQFPCDSCENMSENISVHKSHFEKEHEDVEFCVNCVFPKCDYETSIPEELIEHFELIHHRWIEKTLRKKCLKMITG